MANNFSGDSNCLAVYNFESTITADDQGTNTLYQAGPTADTTTYKIGSQSAYFDGSTDRFYVTDVSQNGMPLENTNNNGIISLCYWVYYTDSSIYAHFDGAISKWSSGNLSFVISRGHGGDKYHEITYDGGGGTETSTHYGTTVGENKWYHVGVTLDGNTGDYRIRIWDDDAGALLDSDTTGTFTSTPIHISNSAWTIGGYTTYYHKGNFDEVVMWDRVLSADEIDKVRSGSFGVNALWDKLDTVSASNLAEINTATIDSDTNPSAGEVKTWNGQKTQQTPIPSGLIIPYTGGAGGAPAGWTIYDTADAKAIVGAGSTYAVDDNGAGTATITADLLSAGDHTGSNAISTVATNGGWYRTSTTEGAHAHTDVLSYTAPYQECYLIKSGFNQTEFPIDSVLFTDSEDKSGVSSDNTNIWTGGGSILHANAGTSTGGSNTNASSVSSSSGSHVHGIADSGDGSGSNAANAVGAHTHTKTYTHTNNMKQRLMAAWSDSVSAISLEDYGANIIGMYESTTPPDGWYLCDGTNSTPDLRDYFIQPVAQASAGSAAGDGTVNTACTAATHGTHNHSFSNEDGGGSGTAYHSDNVTMASHAAVDQDDTFLPPYYALAFIMYGGV